MEEDQKQEHSSRMKKKWEDPEYRDRVMKSRQSTKQRAIDMRVEIGEDIQGIITLFKLCISSLEDLLRRL